jgi:hypothetical protein
MVWEGGGAAEMPKRYWENHETILRTREFIPSSSNAPGDVPLVVHQIPTDNTLSWKAASSPRITVSSSMETHLYNSALPQSTQSIKLTNREYSTMLDWVSNGITLVPVMLHGYESAAKISPILSATGSMASGFAQSQRDAGKNLTSGQTTARAFIAGGESIGISFFATGVGISTGISGAIVGSAAGPVGTGVGGVVGFSGGYLLTVNVIGAGVNEFNEEKIFPTYDLSEGE